MTHYPCTDTEYCAQLVKCKWLNNVLTKLKRCEDIINNPPLCHCCSKLKREHILPEFFRSVFFWNKKVRKELSCKAKLSIYQSIYVPTLTYGHELWVMTERTRSRIQAAEMSFLRRVTGRSLRDRVRSSVAREELRVEPLLLDIERSQLRWLGHLFWMPPGRLPVEVFWAHRTGRRPRGRPRTRWRDYVSRLAWGRLMALFHCMVRYGSARLVTVRYSSVLVGLLFHCSLVPL